jgi:hypothetical protein
LITKSPHRYPGGPGLQPGHEPVCSDLTESLSAQCAADPSEEPCTAKAESGDHRRRRWCAIADPPPGTSATTATSAQLRVRSSARPVEAHMGKVADSSHTRLLRSGLVGERVVFVGDEPAVAVAPQSDCQPEPVAGVALELLRGAATQQSVGKGHVLPGGDVE